MTQSQLIKMFSDATGYNATASKVCLTLMGNIMAAELIGGGEVPLPGIGKLVAKATKARMGRNPKTGEAMQIPAGKKVLFRIGKELKESLN